MLNDMMIKFWGLTQTAKDRVSEERGATTVEYIMILGIMAIIVAALFLADDGIRDKIMGLGDSIKNALTGAAECEAGQSC